MNLISEDYLMHHGVKGMKWGVRHDPQPTGRMRRRAANQQYRQSVKAAGRRNIQSFRENYGSREARRSANQQFRNEVNAAKQKNKEAFALTDKQKKMAKRIAIGAAVVAGVGLATYGGVKVAKLHKTRSFNKAIVAKYLQDNAGYDTAIRYGKGVNQTRISGKHTILKTANIKNTKYGPSLRVTNSEVYKTPKETRKMMNSKIIGVNGKPRHMYKSDIKKYKKLYDTVYKNYL